MDSPKPFYCRVIQLRHSYIVFQLKSIIDARHLFLIYGTRRSILECRQSFLSLQWTYRLSVYYMKDRILLYQNHQQYNQGLCMWVGIFVTAHASQFQHSRSFPFFLINSIIIIINKSSKFYKIKNNNNINYIYFLFFYVRLSYFYFLEFVNE